MGTRYRKLLHNTVESYNHKAGYATARGPGRKNPRLPAGPYFYPHGKAPKHGIEKHKMFNQPVTKRISKKAPGIYQTRFQSTMHLSNYPSWGKHKAYKSYSVHEAYPIAIGVGGLAAVGGGYYYYRKRKGKQQRVRNTRRKRI